MLAWKVQMLDVGAGVRKLDIGAGGGDDAEGDRSRRWK